MCRVIVALTCLLLLSLRGEAQTIEQHILRGLTKVHVLIEYLDDDAIKCALTRDLMRNAVLYPVSSAKIQVITPPANASTVLYVDTDSLFLKPSQSCVTSVQMKVISFQSVTLDFSPRKLVYEISLWEKRTLRFSSQSEHARHVAEGIEGLAKQFIADWNLDNKASESNAGAGVTHSQARGPVTFDDLAPTKPFAARAIGKMTADTTFWLIAIMYSLLAYFHGHQGSHIAAIKSGQAKLNPVLLWILLVYNWLFFVPWLFLIWYGYKTIWWYAVGVFVIGWVFRLVWTKIGMVTGIIKNAWSISLIGIPIIPALLFCMVELADFKNSLASETWLGSAEPEAAAWPGNRLLKE